MDYIPVNFEPNNTVQQAAEIRSGGYQITGTGEDWFRFKGNPGEIVIVMNPTDGRDVNMILYNDKNQILSSSYAPGQETIRYQISDSSNYYVKVFPTAYSDANYTLELSVPSGSWATTLNYGPIRDVSVGLYDIDNDGKQEIFVGTSKALDSSLREVRPAGFVCLEDDGSIKWSRTFPAMSSNDPQTGQRYNTTSVSTAPAFADVDGDGTINIIVGVGADSTGDAGFSVVGQPGDKGGVYALNPDGSTLWYYQARDIIGGASNTGDGRPDGVYGSPVVFDIDGDGKSEVIIQGWDQGVTFLDGRTGAEKRHVHLADTIWSTPRIADLNGDGRFEVLTSADITENADARTQTGGIFHVISADGSQSTPGFDQPIGNPNYTMLRGKVEEQVLWSSPITGDIDGDGMLEIAYGTGNYLPDPLGSYIRVWEHDGTLKFKLNTNGRTFATPLFVDLDGDGDLEIVAATLKGYVHAWNSNGQPLFSVTPATCGGGIGNPIFSSPIAVDLDGDGKQELLFSQGDQTIILRHDGQQFTSQGLCQFVNNFYKGSPAARDIDGDGKIDLISGGTTSNKDQGVVYRRANPFNTSSANFITARHQFHQSQINIESFVGRFYKVVLNRTAEPRGLNDWTDRLSTGINAGADVARGFIFSQEFINRQLNNADFLTVLYRAFFNREPDSSGYNDWMNKMTAGTNREKVLDGFIYSQEFKNLCLTYSIRPSR